MEFYGTIPAGEEWPNPSEPLLLSTVNVYKAALLDLFVKQHAKFQHNLKWEDVWTVDCCLLYDIIKKRKVRINRRSYKKKFDNIFAPYTCVIEIVQIEQSLWDKGCTSNNVKVFCWLCLRFVFLFSLRGMLHCKSIFKAELSDMWGLEIHKFWDPNACIQCSCSLQKTKLLSIHYISPIKTVIMIWLLVDICCKS